MVTAVKHSGRQSYMVIVVAKQGVDISRFGKCRSLADVFGNLLSVIAKIVLLTKTLDR